MLCNCICGIFLEGSDSNCKSIINNCIIGDIVRLNSTSLTKSFKSLLQIKFVGPMQKSEETVSPQLYSMSLYVICFLNSSLNNSCLLFLKFKSSKFKSLLFLKETFVEL